MHDHNTRWPDSAIPPAIFPIPILLQFLIYNVALHEKGYFLNHFGIFVSNFDESPSWLGEVLRLLFFKIYTWITTNCCLPFWLWKNNSKFVVIALHFKFQEIVYNIDPLSLGSETSRRTRRRNRQNRRRVAPTRDTFFAFRDNLEFPVTNRPQNFFADTPFDEPITTTPLATTTTEQPQTFDVNQLAVIRSGDWKLITGPKGYSGLVPNPDSDIAGCK